MAAALKDKELLEKCRAECAIAKALNDAPAVDAAPVVHGHWIVKEKMGKLICSNCGKGIIARGEMQIILAKEQEHYCYHCGAKMYEERHEAFGDSDALAESGLNGLQSAT